MIEFIYYIKGFTFDNSKSKSPLKKDLIKIKSLNSPEEPSFFSLRAQQQSSREEKQPVCGTWQTQNEVSLKIKQHLE